MTDEVFYSGYCRALDGSRTVTAETEDGVLTDADCGYPDCLYAPNCPIAAQLRVLDN